ncbi:MAG TPA: cell division protein FtsZ [Patescibacteria group bacterium]|nr:cell division protein FtsZ [Patescibacteria group bacterium]
MGSLTIAERSIEEIAKEAIPQISVLGVGGGGSNIVSWMKRGMTGVRTYALNSDAQHLSITKADERILLGYRTTGGLGCGGFPEQGEAAAEESTVQIEKAVGDSNLVFVTTTLGGGTGTGASPIVAKISKELGALTLGVVTIPFEVEGTRLDRAKEGLQKLVDICDSVIVIDNNSLRKMAGNLPLKEAFGVANEHIARFIKNMAEAISVPGLMNLDFADMKAIMKDGGICAIGFGEGAGDNKVEGAVERALDSQLLDIGDIRDAKGALVYIDGGEDMTLEDVNRAGELVLDRVSSSARVTWGARVNSDLEDKLKATVVLAGVESPFLKAKRMSVSATEKPKKVLVAKKAEKPNPTAKPAKKAKKSIKLARSS